MRDERKQGMGWLKRTGVGCGVLLVATVVLVALNLDSIRESKWYQSFSEVREEIGHLLELRSAVQAQYPSDKISVNANADFGASSDEPSAAVSKTLSIELVKPHFDLPSSDDPALREEAARGIARWVARHYASIDYYDEIEILFTQQIGVGITWKTSQKYRFTVAELTAPD